MGYSFIKQFNEKIEAIPIENVHPTFDNIVSLDYPLSRPLYIYVRKNRLNQVEGLQNFVDFYRSDAVSGEKGILVNLGLVPFNPKTKPPIKTL
jgi:phosphate transport system substrate-binding protein